jgi:hypothetical protein
VETQLEDTLATFASADADTIEGIVVRNQQAHQQSTTSQVVTAAVAWFADHDRAAAGQLPTLDTAST